MQTLPLPLILICGPSGNYETSWKENINFQRILVECDFSPNPILGLRYALGIAQHFHSEVNITLVCKPGDCRDLIGATIESKKEPPQNLQNQINAKLTNLFPQGTLTSCRINTEFLADRPGEEVIKYAKANKVNLIVLRTRIQGLADNPIKNHIAHFVYRRSTCPILLVRSRT